MDRVHQGLVLSLLCVYFVVVELFGGRQFLFKVIRSGYLSHYSHNLGLLNALVCGRYNLLLTIRSGYILFAYCKTLCTHDFIFNHKQSFLLWILPSR